MHAYKYIHDKLKQGFLWKKNHINYDAYNVFIRESYILVFCMQAYILNFLDNFLFFLLFYPRKLTWSNLHNLELKLSTDPQRLITLDIRCLVLKLLCSVSSAKSLMVEKHKYQFYVLLMPLSHLLILISCSSHSIANLENLISMSQMQIPYYSECYRYLLFQNDI